MVNMKGKAAQKGMPTLEELKKAPRELHLPKYNACGPKSQYALRKSSKYAEMMKLAGKTPVGTSPYGKPYNLLDKKCFAHDKVYSNPKASVDAVRASDDKLAASAMKIARTAGTNASQRIAAFAVAKAFGLKKKAEDSGLIRRGAFAAGGERRTTKDVLKQKAKEVAAGAIKDVVKGIVKPKDDKKGGAKDIMAGVVRGAVKNVVNPRTDKPTAVKRTPTKPDDEVFRILPVRRKRSRK